MSYQMNVQIAMYNLIKVIVITVYYGVDLKRHFIVMNVEFVLEDQERIIDIVKNVIHVLMY